LFADVHGRTGRKPRFSGVSGGEFANNFPFHSYLQTMSIPFCLNTPLQHIKP
jgi:hypothetical protein